MDRGWWSLTTTIPSEQLSDCTLEHIAKLIKEGYTSGEIIEEDE